MKVNAEMITKIWTDVGRLDHYTIVGASDSYLSKTVEVSVENLMNG